MTTGLGVFVTWAELVLIPFYIEPLESSKVNFVICPQVAEEIAFNLRSHLNILLDSSVWRRQKKSLPEIWNNTNGYYSTNFIHYYVLIVYRPIMVNSSVVDDFSFQQLWTKNNICLMLTFYKIILSFKVFLYFRTDIYIIGLNLPDCLLHVLKSLSKLRGQEERHDVRAHAHFPLVTLTNNPIVMLVGILIRQITISFLTDYNAITVDGSIACSLYCSNKVFL